ncbi:MAG: Hpt domain-containing protein, partial [Paracoccus sp. (in: a-proteobacteria)]|nr:Hpt domain-containing protein [Paracoccus sp. (in: a-proteobacteria)]
MSNDPMAEIRASFFIECEELLENLQDALNQMDQGVQDPELINVVFRAVHSIKGGAGAFGLDALVGFAHRYETVMDAVRSGQLDPAPEALRHFFAAADCLADHVRAARDEGDSPEGAEAVITALETLLGVDALPAEEEVTFSPMGLSFDFGDPAPAGEPGWKITFTPHAALYSSGNEAALILRSLSQLGRTTARCLIPDDLPAPGIDNAEIPRLGWEVTLQGDVTEADIRQIFDFVADVCDVDITATALSEPCPEGMSASDIAPAAIS